MKLSALRIDAERASGGVWFDYMPGVRFLIARWQNPAAEKRREELALAHASQGQEIQLEDDDLKQAAAEHILLGWEGITDDEGNEIPYNKETALKWLRDPELADVWSFVKVKSTQRGAYVSSAAVGNS